MNDERTHARPADPPPLGALIDDTGSPAQAYFERAVRTLARSLDLPDVQRKLIEACERFFYLTEKSEWNIPLTPAEIAELDRCIETIQSHWHVWNEKTRPPRRIILR